MEYAAIYVQGYNDKEFVKHSLSFDGKELRTLGVIPHQSKIIIDKENAAILKGFIDIISKEI
jgi:hypothetical protein